MIKIESVIRSQVIPETSIGYIKIIQFQEETAKDFETELKNLEKLNITGLILDLRNNPGGLLDEATHVTALLIGGDQLGRLYAWTCSRTECRNNLSQGS